MTHRLRSPLRNLLPGLLVAATAVAPMHAEAAPKPPAKTASKAATSNATSGTAALLDKYDAASDIFIGMMEQLSTQIPHPSKNPRENMYAGLAAIWLGGLTGAAFAPPAGAVIGGAVGALEGGVGAVPGAGIGAGVGVGVAVGDLVLLGLLTFKAVEYIESKYPAAQYSMLPTESEAAPTSAFAYQRALPHSGAWGPAFVMGPSHAGPYESLVVHIIQSVFDSDMGQIATNWSSQANLSQFGFLEPAVARIAYIQTHGRVRPGAKQAAPMSSFLKNASMALTANTAAIEQSWLAALGVASTTVKVKDGKVEISTPSVLRSVGAPAKITRSFGTLTTPKIGGDGGATPWIRGKLEPGDFTVQVKDPTVVGSGADKGKIRVVLQVAKNSTLGKGTLEYRWNNATATIGGNLTAKLGATLTASAYFEIQGGVLVLDRIAVGNVSASVAMPPIPGPLQAALGASLATVTSKVGDLAESLMEANALEQAFNQAAQKSHKALAKAIESTAAAQGMTEVTGIASISVTGGKLVVTAMGKKVQLPATPSKAAVSSAYNKAKKSIG